MAKKTTARPPLPAAGAKQLHGQYRARTGRRFIITNCAPHGFGLYSYNVPDARSHQTDARELRRLIILGSFIRLSA